MRRRASVERDTRVRPRVIFSGSLAVVITATATMIVTTLSPTEAESSRAPACPDVPRAARGTTTITCTTGPTVLTIAGERQPVVLDDTQVRVLRSSLSGRTLRVRLRIRNETTTPVRAPAGRGQLYVRVAGSERLRPGSMIRSRHRRSTATARFEVPAAAARRLRGGTGEAALAIVPWNELGDKRPRSLGIVRLAPVRGTP